MASNESGNRQSAGIIDGFAFVFMLFRPSGSGCNEHWYWYGPYRDLYHTSAQDAITR